ncbi:MAG: YfhO family protein, partial [Lachnospiraceae bacterium]|nr:YfhO family protein [Lachnospiraceae bacterium]
KISLSSAMFNLFLKKTLRLEKWYTILFSVTYSLCTYVIAMQTNIIWLDALYILPILMLVLFRFMNDASYLPLIPVYAFLFLTNFYMGYIVGIYSALVFLLLLIYKMTNKDHWSLKYCLKKVLLYTFSVFIAACVCAIILLPCASELLSQRSADTDAFKLISITLPDLFNNLFSGEMQSLGVPIPLIYCGLPVLLLLPFYYSSSDILQKEKYLSSTILIFYTISALFLPLYRFVHAFDAPNWYGHRYSICVVFTLLFMVCRTVPHLDRICIRKISIYVIGLILFYSVMIPFQRSFLSSTYSLNTQGWLIINSAFLVLYIFYLLSYQKKRIQKVLPFLLTLTLCSELILNGIHCMSYNNFGFFSEDTISQWESTERLVSTELASADKDFFRQRITNEINLNASSRFHYPGVNSFSTTDNVKLRKALSSLGISSSFMIIFDHGYTDLLKMLFGIKYEYDLNDMEHSLKSTPFALPLGFMVQFSLLGYRAGEDPFLNQQELINSMSGRNDQFFIPVPADAIHYEAKNMELYNFDDSIMFQHITDIASNGIVTFSIDNPEGYPIYAYIPVSEDPVLNSTAPRAYGIPSGFAREEYVSDGSIILLPYENGKSTLKLEFTSGEYFDYTISDLLFYFYDPSALYDVYSHFMEYPLQIEAWSDGYIRGTIDVPEELPILFTSIPYDKGWSATVDGKPVPCGVCIESSFIALPLNTGHHTVEFSYEHPMLNVGRMISGVSICIILLLLLFEYRKHTFKRNQTEKENDHK